MWEQAGVFFLERSLCQQSRKKKKSSCSSDAEKRKNKGSRKQAGTQARKVDFHKSRTIALPKTVTINISIFKVCPREPMKSK